METCEFCQSKQEGPYRLDCEVCGYPIHGSEAEKKIFEEKNEPLKNLIDESESALSWARFFLLWPWLAIFAVSAYYFAWPHVMFIPLAVITVVCGFFIAAYFLAPWKPVPVLIAVLIFLPVTVVLGFLRSGVSGMWFVIPALMLLSYGNALYTSWKTEKALRGRSGGV